MELQGNEFAAVLLAFRDVTARPDYHRTRTLPATLTEAVVIVPPEISGPHTFGAFALTRLEYDQRSQFDDLLPLVADAMLSSKVIRLAYETNPARPQQLIIRVTLVDP